MRFGLTAINPALGIGASGAYGYITAPPGSEIKHAAISALASTMDILAGGVNPASVTWNATSGAAIGAWEQAAYGGGWDEIKTGALFGGAMNGFFALGQKPNVRTFFDSLDDSVGSHLGLTGPKPPIIDGPATFVNDPSGHLPGSGLADVDGGTIRLLGQGADGTTTTLRPPSPDEPAIGRPPTATDGPRAAAVSDDGFGPAPVATGEGGLRPADTGLGGPVKVLPPGSGPEEPTWAGGQRQDLPPGDEAPAGFVRERNLEWLNQTDTRIRDIWQEVGGGRQPDAWDRFNQRIGEEIDAGNLSRSEVDGYFELMDRDLGGAKPSGWEQGLESPSIRDMDVDGARDFVRNAVDSDMPADQLAPFANRSQRDLALLEEQGWITPQQAEVLTTRASAAVNEATVNSAQTAIDKFEAGSHVRVEEVLVGDSGASAAGGPRSVGSDNDKTFVPRFNEDDLLDYARNRYPNMPPEQAVATAHQELTQRYADRHAFEIDDYLRRNYNVRLEDLGVGAYDGISTQRPGAQADLYGAGTTRVRQSVQGEATVIRRDGSSYQASGDALVDAEHLGRWQHNRADEPMTGYDNVRRMTDADYQQSIQEQIRKVERLDPTDTSRPQIQDGAKSVQRAAEASRRMGRDAMDPDVVEVANRLRQEPQRTPQILQDAGMTREQFLTRARENVLRLRQEE